MDETDEIEPLRYQIQKHIHITRIFFYTDGQNQHKNNSKNIYAKSIEIKFFKL